LPVFVMRSRRRPRREHCVDVVEGDSERERVPSILERESEVFRDDAPLGEAECSPQKFAAGSPTAGGCRAEEQVAVDTLRRCPAEDAVRRLVSWERCDHGRDLLLERGARIEVRRPVGTFGGSPDIAGRGERQEAPWCVHVAKSCLQIRSHARVAVGPVELEESARRRVERLVVRIADGSDPERRLAGRDRPVDLTVDERLELHQRDDRARGRRAGDAEDGLEDVPLLAVVDRVQRGAQPKRRDSESLQVRAERILEPGPSAEETHGAAMIAPSQ